MPKEHAVIVYGRFQPPTIAHHMVAQKAIEKANSVGGDHFIYGSHSEGSEDNPLSTETKLSHMQTVLGTKNVIVDKNIKGIAHVLRDVHDKGYKKITLIAGADRIEGFNKFKEYFGKKTKSSSGDILDLSNIRSEDFNIESAGERDPDSDPDPTDMKSVSGTKMRRAADSGDYETFKSMLPSHVSDKQANKMMSDVKGGLEDVREKDRQAKAVKAAAKASKPKKLKEETSPTTRMKLAKAARRTAKRRAMIRKIRSRRRKNIPQLKKRAKNEVKDQLRRKAFRGNWKKLSYSQRASIDRMINKRKPMIDTMVKRIMPNVIRGESQRLRNINSSFDPVVDNFMSNFISEALVRKKVKREPLDTEGKVRRRAQNRVNKRSQRNRDDNKKAVGNIKGTVMVVKSKRGGDIEIIDKESFNPATHSVLVKPEEANVGKVKEFLRNKAFTNTVTSERLFGYIDGMGDGKSDKKGKAKVKTEKKEKTSKSQKEESNEVQPQQQMITATKKASKKDTFPTTHGAGEMEAGMAYSVNTAYGVSPSQIKSSGLIDSKDLDATISNPHESFMPSCSRAAQAIIKQFPGMRVRHLGRKKDSNLTPDAKKNGVVDRTSKADLGIEDENGNQIAGISVKMGGETQLTSGSPNETINFLQWSALQMGDKMSPDIQKQLESLVKFMRQEMMGNPRTQRGPTGLFLTGGELEGQDPEVARREKTHRDFTEKLSTLLNSDKKLATNFIFALLTGYGKFNEGDPGIATHLMSANKDGTDAKVTPITMDYAEKLVGKIKFQGTIKSSAIETGDIGQKWEEFKERKKKLGEKVSLLEDFRQYSFRSVLRAFAPISESMNYLSGKNLVKLLIEKISNDEMAVVKPPEPQNEKEAVDYLEDAIAYIGDDYFKFMQFFGDAIDLTTNSPIIDFTEYATPQTLNVNKIFVNGKEFQIPVEEPMNYDQFGQQSSPLSEEKQRNYRKEYDNYHSKPEQRANRSKRVLARRLMMKLGKVKKGDGKDVDHRDGNPKNNGKHNLRVRSKSENRADNA